MFLNDWYDSDGRYYFKFSKNKNFNIHHFKDCIVIYIGNWVFTDCRICACTETLVSFVSTMRLIIINKDEKRN